MSLLAACLTAALAAPSTSPSTVTAAETRLEARTPRFEAVLEPTVARIDAISGSVISASARRAKVERILAGLTPVIAAYGREARADFEAMAVASPPARAAELRRYGDALVAYLDRLPAEIRAGAEQDIAHEFGR